MESRITVLKLRIVELFHNRSIPEVFIFGTPIAPPPMQEESVIVRTCAKS